MINEIQNQERSRVCGHAISATFINMNLPPPTVPPPTRPTTKGVAILLMQGDIAGRALKNLFEGAK